MSDGPCPSLPKPNFLARTANRLRQSTRPKDPVDLEFEIDHSNIPADFLKADIKVRERRHIMFATDQQLDYLSRAKGWYIDGTFKLCRHPFTQLLSINGFVRKDDHVKQVPFLFVLMSGRKASDYRKVLRELLTILPAPLSVLSVTVDFEMALWSAIRTVLPDVVVRGCAFHWTQTLWRKVCT